jgi:hypothetical protein
MTRCARARLATHVVTTAALALLVTACSGSPQGSQVAQLGSIARGSSSSSRPAASGQADLALAYAQCMRSHGVPSWPDPNGSGVFDKTEITSQHLGVSDSMLQAARTACQHLLPSGGSGGRGPTAAEVQQALRFSQCMRTHGILNFPDPDSSGRIPDPASLGIDQGAPRFEAANQACAADRPPYVPSNAQYNTFASSRP